jgi:hypothetical protein
MMFRRALYHYAEFGQNRGNSMEIYKEQTDTHTLLYTYEVLLESSWTVIVVISSVKEDERGGQGHTSINLLHQSAM